MPELPEVEVVRQGLERHVAGRTVDKVSVLHPRAVRRHLAGVTDFTDALAGRTIAGARRRGKYLWLPIGEDALLAHLGMSGQLLVGDPARPLSPHVRAVFTFTDNGPDLRFTDQRTFGHLLFVPGGADLPGPITHIAPDPLEPAFDEAGFALALRRRRTGIKRALLDQSLISGVGNIYADEVNGESGYFDRSLAVYGQEGRPCPRCGTPVRRDPFMNRSAYTCPRCQPRPRNGRW